MPVTPIIATGGLRKLQRDLRAMIPDAARETRETVKEALQPMVAVARSRGHSRRQTGELGDSWKATMRGAQGALTNPLPQAKPLEFGGTIAPRGTPISLAPATNMVYGPGGAIEKGKAETERRLLTGFASLARRHGFGGV